MTYICDNPEILLYHFDIFLFGESVNDVLIFSTLTKGDGSAMELLSDDVIPLLSCSMELKKNPIILNRHSI